MMGTFILIVILLSLHGTVLFGWIKLGWDEEVFVRLFSVAAGLYFLPCAFLYGLPGLLSEYSFFAWLIYFAIAGRPLVAAYHTLSSRIHAQQEKARAEAAVAAQAAAAARAKAEADSRAHAYDQFARKFENATRAVAIAEGRLQTAYNSIGAVVELNTSAECHRIISTAMAGNGDPWNKLKELEAGLNSELSQLKNCLQRYQTALDAFDNAKEKIIRNQSATLLGELDAISKRLAPQLVYGILKRRQWQDANDALGMMTDRLVLLSKTASGEGRGSNEQPKKPFVASPQTTLDEAYAALGVGAEWPMRAIETHVKALRMRYYVDHGKNEEDRTQRNAYMQQVNAAWSVVQKKRDKD